LFLIAREEFPRVFSRYTSEMHGQWISSGLQRQRKGLPAPRRFL